MALFSVDTSYNGIRLQNCLEFHREIDSVLSNDGRRVSFQLARPKLGLGHIAPRQAVTAAHQYDTSKKIMSGD
jgi:hypothetical protein